MGVARAALADETRLRADKDEMGLVASTALFTDRRNRSGGRWMVAVRWSLDERGSIYWHVKFRQGCRAFRPCHEDVERCLVGELNGAGIACRKRVLGGQMTERPKRQIVIGGKAPDFSNQLVTQRRGWRLGEDRFGWLMDRTVPAGLPLFRGWVARRLDRRPREIGRIEVVLAGNADQGKQMAPMVSLERCIGRLHQLEADRAILGALGSDAVSGGLFGVLRHQFLQLRLGRLMLLEG
jgi:hypothetical protein